MCSCRTYVPVIAALVIPAFDLRAALRLRPGLQTAPAALAPLPGTEPLIGSVTGGGGGAGVRPGMRLGEALATCPQLQLVEQDPATAEQAWEEILRRLEDAGFAVEPAEAGTVFFETKGVERLYGGLEPALKRALAGGRLGVGSAGRRCRAAVRGARRGERRAAGAGADRLRRSRAVVPRAAAADTAPARARALRGARGARSTNDWTACRAARRRRCRTIGAGRPARLEPGEG